MPTKVKAPIQKYLESLEIELKKLPGVVPTDALEDAREHLIRELEAVGCAEPGMTDDELIEHFHQRFGTPNEIAQAYANETDPFRPRLKGIAPGWRFSCPKCGRSAPAATAGVTRVGAYSIGKRTLGFCRECRRLRFFKLNKDLDKTNLTGELIQRPQSIGQRIGFGLLKAVPILLIVLGINWAVGSRNPKSDQSSASIFEIMPPGWRLESSDVVPPAQRDAIGTKLGGRVSQLVNSVVSFEGQTLQVNSIVGSTDNDAIAIEQALRKLKLRQFVQRNGRTVIELVARNDAQIRLALAARYDFAIQPKYVAYQVSFDAAPVVYCNSMKWNQMFNLLLKHRQKSDLATEAKIKHLASESKFGDELFVRRFGLGVAEAEWTITPTPASIDRTTDEEYIRFQLDGLSNFAGVPSVNVQLKVISQTDTGTPSTRTNLQSLLATTHHWPVDDDTIQQLASTICGRAETQQENLEKILNWFRIKSNLRFGGDTAGSRYGVKQVIDQKFGHCWDFSDVFVTLCRARGIPCRQVYGWLYESEGHVWAEVLTEGEGWKHFDPTSGMGCGSDYLPFASSEDGQIPLLYTSGVKIEVVESK